MSNGCVISALGAISGGRSDEGLVRADKAESVLRLPLRLDLENVRDVMEGIENFFWGIDGHLDDLSRNID
jgi:hypothetical protein